MPPELPSEVAAALARIEDLDPGAAQVLGDTMQRILRAADAMAWARERLAALIAAPTDAARLQCVVDEVRTVSGAPDVWAITWTTAGRRLEVRALAGGPDAARTADGRRIVPTEISRSILGRVAEAQRPAWSDDAVADARFLGADSVQAMALRSVGCVPMADRGAVYLHDPTGPGRFTPSIRMRVSALCALAGAILAPPGPAAEVQAEALPGIVGRSKAMMEVFGSVRAFAPMPWPVLILGETGTGKEALARAVHELSGVAGPFVALNCGTVAPDLAESTLFGHERGAFTGADRAKGGLVETATRGTLFLDEVGELAPAVQTKLLRLLQEGTYRRVGDERERRFDGRIVAATHRAVDDEAEGFRADLYHRLSACVVRVPPLRERPGDLPDLARHLLEGSVAELPGAPPLTLTEAASSALGRRSWPGNVRQLQNVLRGGVARCLARGGDAVEPSDLAPAGPSPNGATAWPADLMTATEKFQQERVRIALEASSDNKTAAAEHLGVSRQWLHRLIARWDRQGPW